MTESHSTLAPWVRKLLTPNRRWFLLLLVPAIFFLAGACSGVTDCGAFGNKVDPRLRSSRVRMLLEDPAAAYARFAPYAAMSALVYEQPQSSCSTEAFVANHRKELVKALEDHGWYQDGTVPGLLSCDDEVGTYFRVWTRDRGDHLEVVLVFRGTRGSRDWLLGNLRWVTRSWPGEDQYERSRTYARRVLAYYTTGMGRPTGKPVRFYSAGHSLGGGLAQNALYSFPSDFVQAYAFDPSPVTGFKDAPVLDSGFETETEKRRAGCGCLESPLAQEARVYRIYETDEILSRVRFPLKVLLPLGRQIQEIRFNTDAGHSIAGLAAKAIEFAGDKPLGERGEWWKGKDHRGRNCTQTFMDRLAKSCGLPYDGGNCPR